MTTANRPDTPAVLIQAAEAAAKAAAEAAVFITLWYGADDLTGEKFPLCDARLIAASGPDHWRAVEGLIRAVLAAHHRYWAPSMEGAHCCNPVAFVVCEAAEALRPLAEQVLRDLGDAP